MEYTELDFSWKQEKDKGNIREAIEKIRLQIATNLMMVHNYFSDVQLNKPEDIYAFYRFNDVRSESKQLFSFFKSSANLMRELRYNHQLNVPDSSTLEEYIELENSIKEKMRSI